MRKVMFTSTLALAGILIGLASTASAQSYPPPQYGGDYRDGRADISIFYDGLSPYGDWVEMPDYGWAFAPRVDYGWRPYTRGQWINTDDGWYWDSDERFGWATYHYGRWVNDRRYGWIWVPGHEWAPAWVSWRHGDGYTGWAPLPPRATFQAHVGLNIGGLDIDAYIGRDDYSFVPDRYLVDRGVYQRVVPAQQNVTIINNTTNITNYTVINQRVVNKGIDVTNVERARGGRAVPRVRTVTVDRRDAPRSNRAGEVAVFRPQIQDAPQKRPAQGKSIVKGDAPPPRLVQREKEKAQDRQRRGNDADETVKQVVEKKGPAPKPDVKTQQQNQQQQNQQNQQNAADQRAKAQEQAAADRKAKEQQQQQAQQNAAEQRAKAQEQQANERKARELQQQNAADQRAKAQEQAAADRKAKELQQQQAQQKAQEQQANERKARELQQQNAADQRAKAQEQAAADRKAKELQQQEAANQRAKAQEQQANERKARELQQQQDAASQRAKAQEQQANERRAREQAQQDAANQRAKAQEQQANERKARETQQQQDAASQRAKAQEQQANERKAREQAQQQQQAAKNKKNPKATPTPEPPPQR